MTVKHIPATTIRMCDACEIILGDEYYLVRIYASKGCVRWKVDLCFGCACRRFESLMKDEYKDDDYER
jgi:hypothetical protein